MSRDPRAWLRGPRSLAGRVTLAAVIAVGAALAVGGTGVVVAAGKADRKALDRELSGLASRLDRPGVRELRPDHDDAVAGGGTISTPGSLPGAAGDDAGTGSTGDGAATGDGGASGSGDGVTTDGAGVGTSPYGPPGVLPGDRGGPGRGRGGPPPTLDPGSDRFARIVTAGGVALSQGAAVPAGFPLPRAGMATAAPCAKPSTSGEAESLE